jgi:hypothetical protein
MIYTQDRWLANLRGWFFLNATFETLVIKQCKEFLLVDVFNYTMPETPEQLTLLLASLIGI